MELAELIQNIRQFFLGQYNGSLDGSMSFLAFEPLGLMISPDDFKHNGSFDPTVAQQEVSLMVDVVPAISDIFEPDATNKISDQYGELTGDGNNLRGSLMFYDQHVAPEVTDQYLALFANLKSTAQKRFGQSAEQASVLNPSAQIAACNANPADWYDKDSPIWQKKTFQETHSAPVPTPASGKLDFVWKLNPNAAVMSNNSHVKAVLLNHPGILTIKQADLQPAAAKTIPAPVPATSVPKNIVPPSAADTQPILKEAETVPPVKPEPGLMINKTNYPVLRSTLPFSQMVNVNRVIGLNTNIVTQPVNSSRFTIDLSYSLVRIERDWIYRPLLDKAQLWYGLATKAGDYSTGENSPANKGLMRCIPKAMIVVKDLAISATWSEDDKRSAATSYGFGCFNISNSPPISASTNNQLVVPGIQIIAWICEVLPKLPLNDDPGMAAAPAAANNSSSATNDTSVGSNDQPAPANNNGVKTS
ncbi:MAG TPA: hypothetical protein VIU45_09210 [Chitinophagaceae bacterium]